MDEVILVYKTDNHHSYASRDLIGVATNEQSVINLIDIQAEKENEKIDVDTIVKDQTQGYEGEGEFAWETVTLDILL